MKYLKIDNEEYLTIKDVYLNLCVARNAISKKIKKLEKKGYIYRNENKRQEIYISRSGYEELKRERIEYLNKMINNESNKNLTNYYEKLRSAIEKPKLWEQFHEEEVIHQIYIKSRKLKNNISEKRGKNA